MNTIVSQFNIQGNVVEVAPLGNGLINTTYRVKTEGDAPDYVLQHVNNAIFPDVDMLMNNIVAVTEHIHGKLVAAGTEDIARKVLKFVRMEQRLEDLLPELPMPPMALKQINKFIPKRVRRNSDDTES